MVDGFEVVDELDRPEVGPRSPPTVPAAVSSGPCASGRDQRRAGIGQRAVAAAAVVERPAFELAGQVGPS